MLDVYGSLHFAGSRTLQAHRPDLSAADRPVVVLRLRGRAALGATFFVVGSDYASSWRDVAVGSTSAAPTPS